MYILESAYGISREPGSRWNILNITNTSVYELFHNYRKIYLTISAVSLVDPIYVDMDSLRVAYSAYTGTVQDLLDTLGNNTLPTTGSIPVTNPKFVKYLDAFRAGYTPTLVPEVGSPTSNATIGQKTKLRLNRDIPETDMRSVYESCLVTINGLLHMTDTDGDYLYVYGAGKSSLKCRQNQVGLISFADIGKIELVPITADMLYKQDTNSTFKDRVYINHGKDLTNKTAMLVVGGYLNFQNPTNFFAVSDSAFGVDLVGMNILARYFESLPYLDYSELGIIGTLNNLDQLDLVQFYSDAVLTKLLTMSQSFIIIVDTPEIFVNKVYLRASKLPGMFTAFKEPKYPLVVGYGRMPEYWKTHEDGQWAVNVQDSAMTHYVFADLDLSTTSSVTNQRVPNEAYFNSRGYLLEIGKDH